MSMAALRAIQSNEKRRLKENEAVRQDFLKLQGDFAVYQVYDNYIVTTQTNVLKRFTDEIDMMLYCLRNFSERTKIK